MKVLVILVCLAVALFVLIPLLERYQHSLGLNKMQGLAKYILPLVGISLVIQLIYYFVQSQ